MNEERLNSLLSAWQQQCAGRDVPAWVRAALPALGEAAELAIETHVREDHIHLYGFPSASDREMFRTLTPANDLEFRYGANAPTLRIEGLTVAGR